MGAKFKRLNVRAARAYCRPLCSDELVTLSCHAFHVLRAVRGTEEGDLATRDRSTLETEQGQCMEDGLTGARMLTEIIALAGLADLVISVGPLS